MANIIIFAVSFFGLSVLFLSKHREIRTGEKNWFGKLLSKFDHRGSKLLYSFHYRAYQVIQTIKFLVMVRIPEKGRVKISKTRDSVITEYQKQKDVIMGKKELNGNGSSSFFLRKMNDNKKENGGENGERGRIEDDSIEGLKN